MDVKNLAETIIEGQKEFIKKAKDPSCRIVTSWRCVENEHGYDILITSECDGWAEETKDVGFLFDLTSAKTAKLRKGITEKEFRNRMGSDCMLIADFITGFKRLCETTPIEEGNEYFAESELSNALEELACGLFITLDGQPNYANILIAKRLGLRVFAGDSDSFGWLTGCVKLTGDARVLVFGW